MQECPGGELPGQNPHESEGKTEEMKPTPLNLFRKKVRQALAEYIASEGCGCCRDYERHEVAAAELGKLLHVPMYNDKSGYNFYKFRRERDVYSEKVNGTPV
jgi:hypothetical protein